MYHAIEHLVFHLRTVLKMASEGEFQVRRFLRSCTLSFTNVTPKRAVARGGNGGEEKAPKIMNAKGRCWPDCIFSSKIVEKGGLANLWPSPSALFSVSLRPQLYWD